MGYNVAIDGPAGAGKSTMAKRIAKELGFVYVDTGALYRAMAYYFIGKGIRQLEGVDVEALCREMDLDIRYDEEGNQKVLLNGEDVTAQLRAEEVGSMASVVAVDGAVRARLLGLQREIAQRENVVMDGRDIGTTVLPNADLKIYLTASVDVRAERRYQELQEKGVACDLEEIKRDIEARDHRDMNREISPLRQAEDAVLVDTSGMTIEQVVEEIKRLYNGGVRLAKTAGFCFGVKRAVDKVYEQLEEARLSEVPLYTYGPIIHNEQVVEDLKSRGVIVISEEEDLEQLKPGKVIIRSHGVPKAIVEKLESLHFEIVDATCPFVKKIHGIVEEQTKAGNHVIIMGNASHPEVEGIRGWACGDVTVIENHEEAEKFVPKDHKSLCIVAQTTFNYNKFQELVEIISKKSYDINVLNTICNATEERQKEAASLAAESDAMIVIGGKSSSNTQKLFEISKKECENTYYIQTLGDLVLQHFKSVRNVGITAGASTPNTIIQEVFDNVRRIKL